MGHYQLHTINQTFRVYSVVKLIWPSFLGDSSWSNFFQINLSDCRQVSSEIALSWMPLNLKEVNIGSGNRVVQTGNKPLPELTQISRHMVSLGGKAAMSQFAATTLFFLARANCPHLMTSTRLCSIPVRRGTTIFSLSSGNVKGVARPVKYFLHNQGVVSFTMHKNNSTNFT